MRTRKPKDPEVLCHRAKLCPKKKKRSRLAPWLLSQTAVMAPISFSYFATFFSDVTIQPEFLRHSKRSFFSFLCCCCCCSVERKSFPQSLLFPVRIERQQYAVGCCCLEQEKRKVMPTTDPLRLLLDVSGMANDDDGDPL